MIGNLWSCGPSGIDDPWEGKLLDFKLALPDNPPLFAWTEYRHALQTGDRGRLERVYREKRYLQRWFEMFENFTPEDPPRTLFSGSNWVRFGRVGKRESRAVV